MLKCEEQLSRRARRQHARTPHLCCARCTHLAVDGLRAVHSEGRSLVLMVSFSGATACGGQEGSVRVAYGGTASADTQILLQRQQLTDDGNPRHMADDALHRH